MSICERAQAVDVVAAGDRQRAARETAAPACGAPGCWRRRRRPADRTTTARLRGPDRPAAVARARCRARARRRARRRRARAASSSARSRVAPGSDEQRRHARAARAGSSMSTSARPSLKLPLAMTTPGIGRDAPSGRSRSSARALRPPPQGFSRGWLPSTIATRAPCGGQEIGGPRAGRAAADDRDIEEGHGQAK